MKQFIIIFSVAVAGWMSSSVFAQGGTVLDPNGPPPRDGYYDKIHTEYRRVVPYSYLREADVMWTRRVWRTLDLREKLNQPLYYPTVPTNMRKNLITILQESVCGIVNPVDPSLSKPPALLGYDAFSGPGFSDDFTIAYTTDEVRAIGNGTPDTTIEYNPNPPYDSIGIKITPRNLDPTTIKTYLLKEDWYFDRQRSVMEPRILGICPIRAMIDPQTDEIRGYQRMYWVYFPHFRKVIVNEEVYNPYNYGHRISFDDLFMKRMFSSLIVKVDNTYDREISEYTKGIDALLEAENIKDIIFKFEHDVWEQ
jgi:gliding motility associated protien GldN